MRLEHENGEVKSLYASLSKGTLVGIEARGARDGLSGRWVNPGTSFEGRSSEASGVEGAQETDERDTLHLPDMLMTNRFPQVWVPSPEERDARQLLQHRQTLVGMRTAVKNQLQGAGDKTRAMPQGKLWREPGRKQLEWKSVPLSSP
jgi:transposase